MKILPTRQQSQVRAKRRQALTLVEMMVTMGIFSMVVMAFVYVQLFGLTQNKIVGSKLGASDQSRVAFDIFARDVRSAKIYEIGSYSTSTATFTGFADGVAKRGNGLRLFLSTNTSIYIVYYIDASTGQMRRLHSGVAGTTLIAKNLTSNPNFTNALYFLAESPTGVVQTDHTHKGVIHATLCFSQYEYPMTFVGGSNYYDFYKMEFKFSPHVPDGP